VHTLGNAAGAADQSGTDLGLGGTTGAITVEAAMPAVALGSNSGAPGATVPIGVSLANSGGMIQATSNDIQYDSTQVNVVLNGDTPDCTVNGSIGKSLLLSVLSGGGSQKILRVGAINFANVSPIADGPLFTCNFKIDPGASAGAKTLTNIPGAANPAGADLTVGAGPAASITVTGQP
jgi:hypothetical protein